MSRNPVISPYGSWKSPITADLIVRGSVGLSQPTIEGDSVYWVELRPTEGGRNVIVRREKDGVANDVNPAPFNARTRVHEYGGGDYIVADSTVYFSNFADQRIYRQIADQEPTAITLDGPMRYAEPILDKNRSRLICVREDHSDPEAEAKNAIVSISTENPEDEQKVLASGNDFYSSPKVSPDGSQLAWLTWSPGMAVSCGWVIFPKQAMWLRAEEWPVGGLNRSFNLSGRRMAFSILLQIEPVGGTWRD
jgi:hypothetical protein